MKRSYESLIVLIALMVLAGWMLRAFFGAWGPILGRH